MDDEEYSCIVSTKGPGWNREGLGAHASPARGAGNVGRPGVLAGLQFLEFGLSACPTSSSGLEYQLACHKVTP